MLRLGITGGIGSGKSTVCLIFKELGVPVYNADERAKFLVDHHPQLKQEIIESFGEKAFENGTYNRSYISSLVFSDKSLLNKLNSIIHPYVFKDWDEFCDLHQDKDYIIKEAAIMLESDGRKTVDRICLVYSPMELRLERLKVRDAENFEISKAKMAAQMSDEDKLKLADLVIYNDGKRSLIEQVMNIHSNLIKH